MKLFRKLSLLFVIGVMCITGCNNKGKTDDKTKGDIKVIKREWAIVIHGGAGTMSKDKMTPSLDSAYRASLSEALNVGKEILIAGGTALEAVEKTINVLEDNPLFNAGKGAVFTHDGRN